ncbi:MAG: P-loop NTPase [Candidatus Zixiibacteriota bacterium]
MIIAIASGKGGTGKTTLSVSLALAAKNEAILVDADVEEPNSNILYSKNIKKKIIGTTELPVIDPEKCDFCKKCSEFCAFNAIVVLDKLKVFPVKDLCKGCGGCKIVCPQNAISEADRRIGEIGFSDDGSFIEGRLDIGEATSTTLIRQLFEKLPDDKDIIVDCPPGAAHPTVESMKMADIVILVTEPTPFGIHDLKEALVITRELKKKVFVIVNRSDLGIEKIENEIGGIPIIMSIPFSKEIAFNYSKGTAPYEISDAWAGKFDKLWQDIREMAR